MVLGAAAITDIAPCQRNGRMSKMTPQHQVGAPEISAAKQGSTRSVYDPEPGRRQERHRHAVGVVLQIVAALIRPIPKAQAVTKVANYSPNH